MQPFWSTGPIVSVATVAIFAVERSKSSFLFVVVRMLLVAMPGAPSSDALAPSSKARSP